MQVYLAISAGVGIIGKWECVQMIACFAWTNLQIINVTNSIIIPVHNVENWLNHCLTSILTSVSESSDYEILLIDDGSIDRSGIICDHFANSNRNIRVHHMQQSGVAAARNAGLELACGEYI